MTVFNRIGPYEIDQEIGRGGMAVVFLARDTRTGAQLALKLVREGADRESQEIRDAEERGAILQKQFSAISERVPRVHEFGSDGGYFYVAMEYLDGENLSDAIGRGPMPAVQALSIATELCRFVEDAHGFEPEGGDRPLRSLLHGDLKPRNIRLTSAGQVKVLDFGIAKALSLSRKVTRNDFGSVAYLSPERLETGEVDQHSDLWAIGVLLYELLTGEQAFRAADTRRLEKEIIARGRPPLLVTLEPRPLGAIVGKLLGPAPADRYASAREIREDIERFSAGQTTRAEDEGWPRLATDEPATRRTRPAAVEDVATRRTTKAGVQPPPIPLETPPPIPGAARHVPVPPLPVPVSSAGPVSGAVPSRKSAQSRDRLLRIAAVVLAVGWMANESCVSSAADRVAGVVPTTELGELGRLWAQYDSLSRRSSLSTTTNDLADALTRQTLTLADRVTANYRSPQPSVREAQWRQLRSALARAIAARPRDDRLRALLRYTDGHLHRIDGEARKARRQVPESQREFAEAIAAFREAAELKTDWPDPYLGLARTFVYGLDDVDRAADALKQAERAGYAIGHREAAQLGDGYRTRADALSRSARDVVGLTQEREYLTRAAELYRLALDQYARAADYEGVAKNIGTAQRGLNTAERRLAALLAAPPDAQEEKQWP
jgi:serine/threonine protein kinase/tetratricopeptide (TPR) repeat protein